MSRISDEVKLAKLRNILRRIEWQKENGYTSGRPHRRLCRRRDRIERELPPGYAEHALRPNSSDRLSLSE